MALRTATRARSALPPDVRMRPARPAWTGSTRRVPSDRPPVKTPKELELANGSYSVNGGSGSDLPGQSGLAGS